MNDDKNQGSKLKRVVDVISTLCTAAKPSDDMPHMGRYYYPRGLPKENDADILWQMTKYIDYEDGEPFWICETEADMLRQFEQNGVVAPYFPLLVSPMPDESKK